MTKKARKRKIEQLSEEEKHGLQKALDDRFLARKSLKPGSSVEIGASLQAPFFDVKIGSTPFQDHEGDTSKLESGESDEIEAFFNGKGTVLGTDWRYDNPFSFDITSLRDHFFDQYRQLISDNENIAAYLLDPKTWPRNRDGFWTPSKAPTSLGNLPYANAVAGCFAPFSKGWFLATIVNEFEKLDSLTNSPELFAGNAQEARIASIGKIGRMVEYYRWIFSHGQHSLRGKKAQISVVQGGKIRSSQFKDRNRTVIQRMKAYVDDGRTISNAASLAYEKDGLGTSPGANRALYYKNRALVKKL